MHLQIASLNEIASEGQKAIEMMEIVGENCKVNSDHISRLPDTILQHILSFLETKIAAQSSVLSRSWRDLWTYAPCLIFECRTSEWGLYSAMLRHQSSTLRRLSFSASHAYDDTRNAVCQWIAFAMRHDVEELILTLHSSSCNTELNELPKGVFSFRSLRILKLSSCKFGDVGTPNLSSLQVLSFYDVHAKDETLSLLIACCPVLKKLGLKSCQSITQLDLSLLELKKMTIQYCDRLTSFKADAPKLRLAKYGGYMEDSEISLRSTVGLMGAELQLCELNKGVSGFVNLAREFGRARVLTIKCTGHLLRESSIKLKSLLERCSPCHNVKQLVLQLGPASSVVALLKIFPKLEDLTMEQDKCSRRRHSYNSGSAWREQSDCGSEIHNLGATSVKCLKLCLKKITFERFRGYDDEVALAKVLVKNAMVLEEMNINDCWGPVNLHLNIKNKLTKMRGCKSAKIIYN